MIEEKEEILQQVVAVLDVFDSYDKGDLIPYAEIEAAMQCEAHTSRGRYVINRSRKITLRDRGIATAAVTNVGISFRVDDEVSQRVPVERNRRAARQIRRGIADMRTVDPANLSDHARGMHIAQLRRMERERLQLNRAACDSEKGRVTESLPRRPLKSEGKAQ